ncbi:hypothetical protein M885DRAFT_589097 [Pelagophyceae sp. CCMP2097]|nr:hypothetical protein M885DRAFT_589097 [Pelagophyceae sp. CCMP2097]
MWRRAILTPDLVEWRHVKYSTWWGAAVLFMATVAALFAVRRHARATLRCTRHAGPRRAARPVGDLALLPEAALLLQSLQEISPEDNDCVLTRAPRGVDRLWDPRRRESFEIAGAALILETRTFPARSHKVTRLVDTSDPNEIRAIVADMTDAGGAHAVEAANAARPPPRARRHPVTAAVVLRDDAGKIHVLHSFDDVGAATAALAKLQAYLGAAAGDAVGPVSLALRYDDSAADEVAVLLCVLALLVIMWRPCLESVRLDTQNNLLAIRRRNLFGVCRFELNSALENVSSLRITEHGDSGESRRRSESDVENAHRRPRIEDDNVRVSSPTRRRFGRSFGRAPSPEFGLRLSLAPHGLNARRGDGSLDMELAFGDKFSDSAQLKRIVEAANALLLASGGHVDLDASSARTCVVCQARPPDTVLYPCRHLHACRKCAAALDDCPICRTSIRDRHTVFC